MRVNYDDLFELHDPLATRPMRLTVSSDPRWDEPDFDRFVGRLCRGEVKPDRPVALCWQSGGEPTDLMWCSYNLICVVSERLRELFSAANLTGWGTYAVTIRDKRGDPVPGYSGLAVTGYAGRLDPARGTVVDKPPPTAKGVGYKVLRGRYFVGDEWDGSDFTDHIVVTRRVVEVFKRNRVRNIQVTPLSEVETPVRWLDRLTFQGDL